MLNKLVEYSGGSHRGDNELGALVTGNEAITYRVGGGGDLLSTPAGRRLIENLVQHSVKLRGRITAELPMNASTAELAAVGNNPARSIPLDWAAMVTRDYVRLQTAITANNLAAPAAYDDNEQTKSETITILRAADQATWGQLTHRPHALWELLPANHWKPNQRAQMSTALGHFRRLLWEIQEMLHRLVNNTY